MRAASLSLAVLFVAIVAANALGWLDAADAWSVRHLMPGLEPSRSVEPSLLDALKPVGRERGGPDLAADAWLYPASAPLSALVVGALCIRLWQRGRRTDAWVWAGAFAVGVSIELLLKHVVTRPPLFADGRHIPGFDDSLPSGHAFRALVLGSLAWWLWRRRAAPVLLWSISVLPLLVVIGWHTPSDVVAGALLALALAAAALALLRGRAGG